MTTVLEGNTETALTVAITSDDRILSGGETGELCLWTTDGDLIERHMYEGDDDITSIVCSKTRPHLIYVAIGCRILALDLRELKTPLYTFAFNEEEINQLHLNEKEEYLAACDDSGQIKVINLFEKRVHKTLRKHTNICATLSFHPKKPWDLISGGYDSKMIQWDFSRGRTVFVVDMEHIGVSGRSEEYMINPPFVHSLSLDPTGKYLACSTESSTVHIFHCQKKNPDYWLTLKGHTQGVSQVHFPKSHPNQLISAGNDEKICVWNLLSISPCLVANGHSDSDPEAAPPVVHEVNSPTATIVHSGKINWLTTLHTNNQTSIIVADNTDKIIMFPYPE